MSLENTYKLGKMDYRVVIQKPTYTRQSNGEMKITGWTTHTTVWAERMAKGGREAYEAEQLTAVNEVNWRVRYLSTIIEDMRVSYNSTYYYITRIDVEGRNQYMILTTEKRD